MQKFGNLPWLLQCVGPARTFFAPCPHDLWMIFGGNSADIGPQMCDDCTDYINFFLGLKSALNIKAPKNPAVHTGWRILAVCAQVLTTGFSTDGAATTPPARKTSLQALRESTPHPTDSRARLPKKDAGPGLPPRKARARGCRQGGPE